MGERRRDRSPAEHGPVCLCIIVGVSKTLYFLHRGLFGFLRQRHFEITGVCSDGPELQRIREMGVRTVVIPIAREPSPLRDMVSLVRLWWFLLWNRFDIVHVSTPKASFLGMLAAWLTCHRNRVFTLRGRAYEDMVGLKRWILACCDRIVCRLATCVIPICRELGQVAIDEGLCRPEKVHFVGAGSSNGIDVSRFERNHTNLQRGRELRARLGIPPEALVILAMGRLRTDKGINELLEAFAELAPCYPTLHLLLVGEQESASPLADRTILMIRQHPRVSHLPWLEDPVPAYAAADIVALPSYREGFGNVAIEASAMELPVVASDVMGCRESTLAGVTGLLVPVANARALRDGLKQLIEDPVLRARLGRNGRRRAEAEFRSEVVWNGLVNRYLTMLGRAGD